MEILYQFILLGSVCWTVDYHSSQLEQQCGNIYEYEKSKHTSRQSCVDRAEYLGTQIQLNRKNKGSYVTEMTINCIPAKAKEGQAADPVPFYHPLTTYRIVWQ
tara:strand:- start:77 stop:385 length:309 start_codon:yes stop_codon:yes gene_type:complete